VLVLQQVHLQQLATVRREQEQRLLAAGGVSQPQARRLPVLVQAVAHYHALHVVGNALL
jgi:hypothetical protein